MNPEITKNWIKKCLTEKKTNSFSTQEGLIEVTNEVLSNLKSNFEDFVSSFNELKSSFTATTDKNKEHDLSIAFLNSPYIYDIVDTKNGFMLFRKGYRLIFTFEKPGQIRIQLIKKEHGETHAFTDAHIQASIHNSVSIQWVHSHFKGFINLERLARYYMELFLVESEKSLSSPSPQTTP